MTPDQMALMIRVFQFGFSTGAITRFDCLRVYVEAYPGQKDQALDAAVAFERGCGYCQDQHEVLKDLTPERLLEFCQDQAS